MSGLTENPIRWPTERICRHITLSKIPEVSAEMFSQVCRTDLSQPGVCLINLGSALDSHDFRRAMVQLGREFDQQNQRREGKKLSFLTSSRFDQQESTRPHLDGGPVNSALILGYEPSEVDSRMGIFDYSKCASDRGMQPQEFLSKHNPMYESELQLLVPYRVELPCFDPTAFQIVLINNSSGSFNEESDDWLGVLHTAEVWQPNHEKRRIVNSLMIGVIDETCSHPLKETDLEEFSQTNRVSRRNYANLHLKDDD